jgi:hypothetical protein
VRSSTVQDRREHDSVLRSGGELGAKHFPHVLDEVEKAGLAGGEWLCEPVFESFDALFGDIRIAQRGGLFLGLGGLAGGSLRGWRDEGRGLRLEFDGIAVLVRLWDVILKSSA